MFEAMDPQAILAHVVNLATAKEPFTALDVLGGLGAAATGWFGFKTVKAVGTKTKAGVIGGAQLTNALVRNPLLLIAIGAAVMLFSVFNSGPSLEERKFAMSRDIARQALADCEAHEVVTKFVFNHLLADKPKNSADREKLAEEMSNDLTPKVYERLVTGVQNHLPAAPVDDVMTTTKVRAPMFALGLLALAVGISRGSGLDNLIARDRLKSKVAIEKAQIEAAAEIAELKTKQTLHTAERERSLREAQAAALRAEADRIMSVSDVKVVTSV